MKKTNSVCNYLMKVVSLLFVCCFFVLANADEGMWTFVNPPLKQLQEKYNFTPTQEWLDHVRLSSVRFMDGGSGSFVSSNGLVMTNHHVAVGQLQKLSTAETDYVATGFFAKAWDEELKCPDLELNVLMSMEDVTDRVVSAVKKAMTEEEALQARTAEIAQIEKASLDKTGLRSNVITLYHGGEYWLYRYKRYTDVRLVFAPERQAAYFGGDSDNFTYPRYDLDVAFFRVYEDDKPIKNEHYLKWNLKGAAENELVFVSGNPGSTRRLDTYSQLEYLRDFHYPMLLKYIDRRIEIANEYAKRGHEQQRRALVQIFGLENAKKALTGEYESLLDQDLMAKKMQAENELIEKVKNNPELQKLYGNPWQDVSEITIKQAGVAREYFYENLRGSRLAGIATTIVRYVTEINKPDAERLDGFHDSEIAELKFKLFSPAPIYPDFDEAILAGTLNMSLAELGAEDPFLKIVLDGASPAETAKRLFTGTQLTNVDYRKALIDGGEQAVQESEDPLIVLAGKIEPMLREQIKWEKEHIESVLKSATEKIARARFAVYGKEVYPDATFTLRLSYGTVAGFPVNGTKAPYKTTLYGLYDRTLSFDREGEFALPQRFWERQEKLNLATPVNFTSTCDIIGGNSGSPVINRDAEVVGLIFDGNIQSLGGRFVYDEVKSRAVAVHTAYIIEALRKLYDAEWLANEIEEIGTY